MNLVLDTNILLSALIKDSKTREIIFKSNWEFYYPEISLLEIKKYEELVLKKSNITKLNYDLLLNKLLSKLILIPSKEIISNLKDAKEIMLKIDPDDVVFIAASLNRNLAIWTDDKDFEKQNSIKVFKTKDVIKIFELTN